MHLSVPSRLDKKKGVKKLSLIKNDRKRSYTSDSESLEGDNVRKNISVTRPFQSLTTGIKRPLEDKSSRINVKFFITTEGKPVVSSIGQHRLDMLNGYHNEGRCGVATLSNLGNTCFLNSILYTLRFTPNFVHNLHHLAGELALAEARLGQAKARSSSLGRNLASLAAGSRSWSTKDLQAVGQAHDIPKSVIQVATERMHELYAGLRAAEMRDSSEPYQAETFLTALRNVNPIFEGNQQQDAHELLMCVLDSIRETCRFLQRRFNHQPEIPNGKILTEQLPMAELEDTSLAGSKTSFGRIRKSWKNKKKAKTSKLDSPTKDPPVIEEENPLSSGEWCRNIGFDFVAEDFEGTTVLRTTCLECEMVTERKQTMCDISVPISEDKSAESGDPSEVYQHACVTSECLRDQNKYWCDRCARYNEARRQVSYETLPRLVVLQLKRFSGGMEKLTGYMPTPRRLACFCDSCCQLGVSQRPHQYALYALIMHLGQTLTGGHYIAYARANYARFSAPYVSCQRDSRSGAPPAVGEKHNFMKSFFARSKSNGTAGGPEKGPPVKRKVPVASNVSAPVLPPSEPSVCSSLECCGVRTGSSEESPERNMWLMCDDETVKPISYEEFDELLSSKPKVRSASTPYLLFYVKIDSD